MSLRQHGLPAAVCLDTRWGSNPLSEKSKTNSIWPQCNELLWTPSRCLRMSRHIHQMEGALVVSTEELDEVRCSALFPAGSFEGTTLDATFRVGLHSSTLEHLQIIIAGRHGGTYPDLSPFKVGGLTIALVACDERTRF